MLTRRLRTRSRPFRHRQYILDAVASRFEEWDRSISDVIQADRERKRADVLLRVRVNAARQSGHSWTAIGLALGISRQAAQQRFGRD